MKIYYFFEKERQDKEPIINAALPIYHIEE